MGKKELTKKQLKKSLKNITEGSIQMKDHLKTAFNSLKKLDKISVGQKIKNNKGDNVTVTPKDNDKILAALRKVEDIYRDIIGGEIKDKEEKDEKEKSTKVKTENEQSEGYGKMPIEVVGENVVKISQKKLNSIIERVIVGRKKQLSEQDKSLRGGKYDSEEEESKKASPISMLKYYGNLLDPLWQKYKAWENEGYDKLSNSSEFKKILDGIKKMVPKIDNKDRQI
jgi:hypothetical protein